MNRVLLVGVYDASLEQVRSDMEARGDEVFITQPDCVDEALQKEPVDLVVLIQHRQKEEPTSPSSYPPLTMTVNGTPPGSILSNARRLLKRYLGFVSRRAKRDELIARERDAEQLRNVAMTKFVSLRDEYDPRPKKVTGHELDILESKVTAADQLMREALGDG